MTFGLLQRIVSPWPSWPLSLRPSKKKPLKLSQTLKCTEDNDEDGVDDDDDDGVGVDNDDCDNDDGSDDDDDFAIACATLLGQQS